MNEINEEIKLTLNMMQGDVDEGAHSELQSHLYSLLEMKRNELQQRLSGRSWVEPDLVELAKPLSTEDLMDGGWWCADTSGDALEAFILYGLENYDDTPWDGSYYACFLFKSGFNLLDRGSEKHTSELKEIHRIGIDFYWGEK